jgi:CBS domain-containing protein
MVPFVGCREAWSATGAPFLSGASSGRRQKEATVKARDLMRPVKVIRPDDPATDLIRAFEDPALRAVAVVSAEGNLIGVISDEDLLYALLPSYVLDDEALARVLEEGAGATLRHRLEGKRVEQCVHTTRRQHALVEPDATLIEVAATMVRSGDPGVLVVEGRRVLGVITVDVLLPALLGTRP